jgi:hypothetical protein
MSDPNRARELLAEELQAQDLPYCFDLTCPNERDAAALRAIERALNGERDAILEECAAELAKVEPDEEAAGGPASWGDFVQVGQGAIRGLKSGDHLGNYILDSRNASG